MIHEYFQIIDIYKKFIYVCKAALQNCYPNVQSLEAVCEIFMMVFSVTELRSESLTYHMRAGQANHSANPTQFRTV